MTSDTSHFIYEKIADDLRARIASNEFLGPKLPPERELASHYNANRITLRKAIGLLEKENLVFRDGTRGTFIGRPRLRKTGNFVVGLVLVGRSRLDQMHSVTIMELERQLKQYSSNMMLFTVSEGEKIEDVLATPLQSKLLDAVIFAGLVSPALAATIAELDIPTVLFGHLMYSSDIEQTFDRVYPNSVEYSYQAVKQLAQNQHRRIALINGPDYQRFLNIYQGYMRALDEFGLVQDESLLVKCSQDTAMAGMKAVEQILDNGIPDAIFVADERLSVGAIQGLKARNVDLSGGVEVITVGTNQSELLGREKVMTVSIDWRKMVEYALEMLLGRINGDDHQPRYQAVPFHITYPAEDI